MSAAGTRDVRERLDVIEVLLGTWGRWEDRSEAEMFVAVPGQLLLMANVCRSKRTGNGPSVVLSI